MIDFDQINRDKESQKLQIWCCENCRAVHFKIGDVSLNFTKNEFMELTGIVIEIYNRELGHGDFYRLVKSHSRDTEILVSQTIA